VDEKATVRWLKRRLTQGNPVNAYPRFSRLFDDMHELL
jgi:hypothetical protein